jgi:hypothetical protein
MEVMDTLVMIIRIQFGGNKMKKINLLLCIVLINGCATLQKTPSYVKQHIDFCFTGKKNSMKDLFKISGYYRSAVPYKRPLSAKTSQVYQWDTTYNYLIFFNNGLVVSRFYDYKRRNYTLNHNLDIQSLLTAITNNKDAELIHEYNQWFDWGFYVVEGQIIRATLIRRSKPILINQAWSMEEKKYQIISTNILREIESKKIIYDSESPQLTRTLTKGNLDLKTFSLIKFDEQVSSYNCWLKKEKWFWCNEEDYKAYMKSLKSK